MMHPNLRQLSELQRTRYLPQPRKRPIKYKKLKTNVNRTNKRLPMRDRETRIR
ncbi:hypothetical protein BofuT4_P137020.1 [Botrytis cinerea T4]|uniref:Uncharacterized protein n=1 Tax=Botryotinia fuckeliana (strain T4) TaxID=999810 RepID=G2YPV9_BOTF4|nr:hypothetical protein BofuT4_P137020.1 [Botrytis cinerea T4]